MAIDTRRLILTAVEAALKDDAPQQKQRKPLLPAKRALLLGAGLMLAGRVAVGSRGREVMGTLHDRLADLEERYLSDDEPDDIVDAEEFDEDYDDDDEFEDDEEFDEEEQSVASE